MGESIERQLGRMEAKLDELIAEKAVEADRRKGVYDRLNALEKWQTRMITAGSVIVAVFALAYKVLIDIAKH